MNEDVNLTAAPQGGSPALRAQGIETISEWRRKDDGVTFYSVARRDGVEIARAEVWRETGESLWRAEIKTPRGEFFKNFHFTCEFALDAAHAELGRFIDASRAA